MVITFVIITLLDMQTARKATSRFYDLLIEEPLGA